MAAMQDRLATLDGLRGVAALGVMLFHAGDLIGPLVPGGYLAVDLFLVLSGFVISRAYDDRIAGLGLHGFFRVRAIRLMPLYLAGLVLRGLAMMAKAATGDAVPTWPAFAMALAMFPAILAPGYLYPFNPPAWSLGVEALINMVYGLARGNLSRWVVLGVITLSFAEVARATLAAGHANLGADWATAFTGLMRGVFSFTVGIALQSLSSHLKVSFLSHRLATLIPLVLVPVLVTDPANRAAWDLFCIAVLFPAIVFAGAAFEGAGRNLWQLLGDTSYALYCIHAPMLLFVRGVVGMLGVNPLIAGLGAVLVIIAMALLLHRYFDAPARAWLADRFKSVTPQQVSEVARNV